MIRRAVVLLALLAATWSSTLAGPVLAVEPVPSPEQTASPGASSPPPDPSAPPAGTTTPSPSAAPSQTPTPAPTATPSATPTPVAVTESPSPSAAAADGAVTLADGTVLPPMPAELMGLSVHAAALAEHDGQPLAFAPGGPPSIMRAADATPMLDDGKGFILEQMALGEPAEPAALGTTAALPNGLRREILGFLPYWVLTDKTAMAALNYELVSTVAYFSVAARQDGSLDRGTTSAPSTGWAGWNSSAMTEVINRAHAAGARVVLTVTMMAWDSASWGRMETLLKSATARTRLVNEIVAAVRARGADGVNMDFELVPTSMRAQYAALVRELKAALRQAGVGSYVTVCVTGGSASWATGYDLAALAAAGAADQLFVMGYDYSWSGSARAGGVAPIDSSYTLDVSGSLADFLRVVPASKLIWGVPYYGRSWTTTTNQLNAPTRGASWSLYYTGHLREAGSRGRLWDATGKVPWYRYWDAGRGSWVQSYYDDAESLGYKYDLVNRYGLAGTGMWHLLMDAGRNELWMLLSDRFVTDTRPPIGGVSILPEVTDGSAVLVSWKAVDYQSGLARYNVQARDRDGGAWTSWLTGTLATEAWWTGEPGHTYEFRIQAVDTRGNAQPWRVAPDRPSTPTPGYFASVGARSVTVRSGAGTTYGANATLAPGSRVLVLDGPVSAAGYQWWEIQYGFMEWPSSEYPRIGWAIVAAAGSPLFVAAAAPNVTTLDPFVTDYAVGGSPFSPNGDGRRDAVTVGYRLRAAATVSLDVVDSSGALVRRAAAGPQAAGSHQLSWDGRTDAGAPAAPGQYLLRVVATEAGGVSHTAPMTAVGPSVLARWGVSVDLASPTVVATSPTSGAGMQPASVAVTVTFSEPMSGVSASTVRLLNGAGAIVPAAVSWNPASRTARLTPNAPLATGGSYELHLAPGLTDAAGNSLGPSASSRFGVAPGTAYTPWRPITFLAGTHRAYRLDADGDLSAVKLGTLPRASGASASQRAELPDLPGAWLYVETGMFAGMWLPEGPLAYLAGETGRDAWPATTRLAFAAGTHVGHRYAADGRVSATRSATLNRASGANASARAVINGRAHWLVTNGVWAGYWVPESPAVHRPGAVDEQRFDDRPRIGLQAGSYTGYAYDAAWRRGSARTASIARASGANVSAWAVIDGRAYWLVANGIWAGTWLPAETRIALAPG